MGGLFVSVHFIAMQAGMSSLSKGTHCMCCDTKVEADKNMSTVLQVIETILYLYFGTVIWNYNYENTEAITVWILPC